MQLTTDKPIENVYIYVSDSLRYDVVSESLAEYENIIKTAASGTNTCASFPTITTGLYPPQHGVWTFWG